MNTTPQIHAESWMVALGLSKVPANLSTKKIIATKKRRLMSPEERINLLYWIAKHKTILGDAGTAEFIYYEMIDLGEIPSHEGVVIVSFDTFTNYYKLANYQISDKYKDERKTCVRCGNEYVRRVTIPYHKWKKQRYCSVPCSNVVIIAKRIAKNNERQKTAA